MLAVFDVRTLFLIGGLASVICAITLWTATRLHRPSAPGLAWSAAGQVFLAAAMLGVALRGIVPDVLSYIVANALGASSFALLYESTRRLVGVRPMPAVAHATLAAAFAVQALLGTTPETHAERLMVTSAFQGGFAALMIPLFARRYRHEPSAPVFGALALSVAFTLVHAARLASVALGGVQTSADGSFVVGAGQALVFGLFALAPMLHAMLMLSWVNGRIAHDLRVLAARDELTGLLNRRSFFERAQARLHGAESAPGPECAVAGLMMIDLDHFKRVNDTHGHATGDRALAHFAALARTTLGAGAELGRYGGEEFCALVMRPGAHEIERLAEKLCAAVRASRPVVGDAVLSLTVSIGITSTEDPARASLAQMLREADRRVYFAKALGRDRVVAEDIPEPPGRPEHASSPPAHADPGMPGAGERRATATAAPSRHAPAGSAVEPVLD